MTFSKIQRVLLIVVPFLLLCSIRVTAQKKHVFYDTVKTVKERVDYSPDTIPIYFKEIVFMSTKVYDIYNTTNGNSKTSVSRDSIVISERWQAGFVVWQTYKKASTLLLWNSGTGISMGIARQPEYYKDDYEPFKSIAGTFLYANKKLVTNKVIYTIKP